MDGAQNKRRPGQTVKVAYGSVYVFKCLLYPGKRGPYQLDLIAISRLTASCITDSASLLNDRDTNQRATKIVGRQGVDVLHGHRNGLTDLASGQTEIDAGRRFRERRGRNRRERRLLKSHANHDGVDHEVRRELVRDR